MRWEMSAWLKMTELFLCVVVFGLHSTTTVWWSSTSGLGWKTVSVLTSTVLCGPIIPQMFRSGPYFYTSRDIVKPINVFLIIYCFLSYLAGSGLVVVQTFKSNNRIISRNVQLFSAAFAVCLAFIFFVDLIFTFRKQEESDDEDD